MTNSVYIETAPDSIQIFLSTGDGAKKSTIRYCLKHCVTPYTDGGTYQNQDVWRLYELYVCRQNESGGFEPALPYPIVNGGEWECALQIEGTPDFHGGYHGYEHYTDITARADGHKLDLGTASRYEAMQFSFEQNSEIYRQGTKNELMATHRKQYCFTGDTLHLHQELVWQQDVTVKHAYMAMLPIRRTADNTDSGAPITDKIQTNLSTAVYDIAKIGHQTPLSSAEQQVSGVTEATVWSDTSHLKATMRLSGRLLPDNSFFVQNTPTYNKLYFSYTGHKNGHCTHLGETWALDSYYTVNMTQK